MRVNQFTEGDRHRFFHGARPVDVTGNAEKFGAVIVFIAKGGKPVGTTAQNRRANGNGFDIVDGGRAAIKPDIGRKWRL